MATEFSMLMIMNAALLAQGQEEVLAAGNGTVEWRLLFRNWPLIVEAELEDGNYMFTRTQANLITRSPGKFGFVDSYLVPSDCLYVRNLWILDDAGNRLRTDWIQDSQYVHVNCPDGVWVEHLVAADAALWTASFARGVQLKMEALIAKAIKEEAGEASNLDLQAEEQFQRARASSSRQRSATEPYRPGKISNARRGGSWRG